MTQKLALDGLLWRQRFGMGVLAIILLYIAIILSIWSMLLQYLRAAKDNLLEREFTNEVSLSN